MLFIGWVGAQIYQSTKPVILTDHHPFKSAKKMERYLAHYDARAQNWPVPSETVFVDTSWGQTFVRISGPADGPPLVLLPGANATSLMWETNIEAFSRDYRVYAVDNVFDFGRSVYVRNLKTPADFVSWFDKLLDALGLEDYARFDFRAVRGRGPVLMDANALPNLAPRQLLATSARWDGLTFPDLIAELVESAIVRHGSTVNG